MQAFNTIGGIICTELHTLSVISVIMSVFVSFSDNTYSWFVDNLVNPLVAFARGFEFAVILVVGLFFVLITVLIVLREAKKTLPKSYSIEIIDLYGQQATINELRQSFATYDVAESYSRLYRATFGNQYKFRVIGCKETKSEDGVSNGSGRVMRHSRTPHK